MKIEAIRTRALLPPKDDLWEVIKKSVKIIPERSVVVVTSKVVAINQGRCVRVGQKSCLAGRQAKVPSTSWYGAGKSQKLRDELAKKEADWYVERMESGGTKWMFTIKGKTLIASAGIDKSNANGFMILWPEEPMKAAQIIRDFLRREYSLKEVGVLITDSHIIPMRRGVVGTAIGYSGFNPLRDYRGKPDIFGRNLLVTVSNVAEALAEAAVVVMGEGKEQTPLALVTDMPWLEFTDKIVEVAIDKDDDLFKPMLNAMKWQKGKGGGNSV